MDEFQRTDEQLNTAPDPAEYDIDAIVAEFSDPPEDAPDDVKIWTPKTEREPEPEPETPLEPTIELLPPKRIKPPKTKPPKAPRVHHELRVPMRGYNAALAVAAWVLLAVTAAVAAFSERAYFGIALPKPVAAYVPPAIFAAHCLLALPELVRGAISLPRKFTPQSYLLLTVLVLAICGIAGAGAFWAAGSLLLTVSFWGGYLRLRAERRAQSLPDAETAEGIMMAQGGAIRAEADAQRVAADTIAENFIDRRLNIFAPILAALTLVIAATFALIAERSFLWSWSLLLIGAYPLGAVLSYARAFARLSKRLFKSGAAVGGLNGAERLCGSAGVIVTDTDLFPPANVSLNGVKTLGDADADRILGYANALLESAGAETAHLFSDAMEQQRSRRYYANQFLAYDAGGLGGEISGDVVLLGGRAFMKTMNVALPQDVRPSSALYLAINGKAAGVFAVTYRASDAVRSGLAALIENRAQLTLLSHDVLVTPAMIGAKYGVPQERITQPPYRQREAAAAIAEDAKPGAIVWRKGFYPFAIAVAGARKLRRAARITSALSLLGAIIGLLLMTLMTLTNAHSAASVWNLLLYHALWLIPTMLLT
ncbi:MAG: hypothetical protein IJS31_02505 [Oscillospiraceae bacterium]|nr:hypothetical protein [Oscillospiraceae bacterium]